MTLADWFTLWSILYPYPAHSYCIILEIIYHIVAFQVWQPHHDQIIFFIQLFPHCQQQSTLLSILLQKVTHLYQLKIWSHLQTQSYIQRLSYCFTFFRLYIASDKGICLFANYCRNHLCHLTIEIIEHLSIIDIDHNIWLSI